MISGPNGCGKSCVLDAIRLLKSAYGSYVQDEFQHWFNEFQLNRQEPDALLSLFQDRTKELRITASFVLSAQEKAYLRERLVSLLIERKWKELEPHMMHRAQKSLAERQRIDAPRIEREAQATAELVMR
ncbi:MAG TPA: hypothetical protein VN613_10120, partial [Gemmatimonadaceae bacterium]|nr:hypothetical protein [Gemmatimonadaceae bacterium]